MTPQHIEEDLSRAYVFAVSARAGMNVSFSQSHDYTIDGHIHEVCRSHGRYVESGIALDFQLKASKRCVDDGNFIKYDFDADTYNYLRTRTDQKHTTPVVLLLLVLPQDENEWLNVSQEALILKKACYWAKITGNFTQNSSTTRIEIPKSQLFDVSAVTEIFANINDTGDFQ